MSRPRGGSASHARSYKITTPRRNPIQKRNPAPPNHMRKRVPIRNFRASTPEPSTSLVSPSPITARDGTVLSKEEIQDRLRKQADKLILRLEDNADKIEKDLPNNVLAYFAQMKDKEEDDVVEIIPTVTIQDEDRSVLPPVIEVEDGEIIDNQRAKTGFTVDDEVVFLEFKRKLDEDVVIIEDTRTIERSKVETMRFQRDGAFPAPRNNNVEDYSKPMTSQQLTGKKLVVKRHWKTATIRIPRNAPIPLMSYNDYLDSLSQFLMRHRGIHCRGPEIMPHFNHPSIVKDRHCFFRFVSYNVLCQKSMDDNRYLYPQIGVYDSYEMWKARWQLLQNELMTMDSDVYFLQEVEADYFEECYKRLFENMKMDGFFTKRSTRADGCAIFWRKSVFDLIEKFSIDLDFEIPGLDKPNVAQIAILKHKHSGRITMFVNTHILFSPKRGDIKLNQLVVIFSHMQQYLSKVHHYIFAGDLNIEPHSPLYNFIRDKSVVIEPETPPFYISTLSGQLRRTVGDVLEHFCLPGKIGADCTFQCDETFITKSDRVQHSMNFANVYDHTSRFGTPEVSTFHKDTGNPDHIFYSVNQVINCQNDVFHVWENGLHLVRRLSLPDRIFMENHVGKLPNTATGSDHLPLLAEFVFY